MKFFHAFLLAFFLSQVLSAQNCGNPSAQIDIQANNIKARILNGGDLFTGGRFYPNPAPAPASNPSTIYAASLWVGGIDPGGNLKMAAVDYRSNTQFDYTAGPLDINGTTTPDNCANWNRFFRVTGVQVAAFLASLPMTQTQAMDQFPAIMAWPGVGNPYFQSAAGFSLPSNNHPLAPFVDADQNGVYDPLAGDYPAVQLRGMAPFVPAEMIWCVFNDNGGVHSATIGQPLKIEVQQMVWAFQCPDHPVLNNSLFTSHRILYKSNEPLDSVFVGIWADVDLGCYEDDYVGCNPALQTMYAYNTDAVDGQPGNTCPGGVVTFPGAAPIQTVTFLNHPLDKFIPYNNNSSGNPPIGSTDPSQASEFYNYLTGTWRDGSPLTDAPGGYGAGNPVDHLYPDNPANPLGWSMCTANIPFGDRRLMGSTRLDPLPPGVIEEMNVAWAFHPDPDLPCSVGTAFSDVAAIHALYQNNFQGACLPLPVKNPVSRRLSIFPNPVLENLTVDVPEITGKTMVQIASMDGRIYWSGEVEKSNARMTIPTTGLPSGMYLLQLLEEGRVPVSEKFIKL